MLEGSVNGPFCNVQKVLEPGIRISMQTGNNSHMLEIICKRRKARAREANYHRGVGEVSSVQQLKEPCGD